MTGDLLLFPEGKQIIRHSHNDWKIEIECERSRRWAKVKVKSCNYKLQVEFENYSVERAKILSFVTRNDNFKSSGKISEFANLLLTSPYSRSLLNAKFPALGIRGKCIWFNGKIRRRNDIQILNAIVLIEKLTEQFDKIVLQNAT